MDGEVVAMTPAPDAIELRHLRAFVAVAEELNFSRAAARLYVSQPALSRQIRALERLVGCDLLRRTTHRVELTLAGEALLDRARALLGDVDAAISATRSVAGELETRLDRLWQPVKELAGPDVDLPALRAANEEMHANFPPLPDIDVRPANADGVPALVLTPRPGRPPSVLLLHGGGYAMGSAFGYRHLASAIAGAADAGVVVPEYRLAPEHPFPAAVDDAVRAYLWLLDTGANAERVTVMGDSAGSGLAMSLLLSLRRDGLPLPGGAVHFCPGIDLTFEEHRGEPAEPQPVLDLDILRWFADAYLAGQPADDELVYPLAADLRGFPPMLIQGGSGDVLVSDAHRLADHARSHGVDVQLTLYPVTTHDFQVFWSFLPEAADAVQAAGRFARRVRAGDPAAASSGGRSHDLLADARFRR